ncbi:hypothetical protein [Amycolatopsis sp. GM8]|uniref:hypothetical protein n=1 Tax=Amycolatopsis sp. GM8 TaxID=2896530 RepID=UPI001F177544|nr:hypothetical protein [Amycolatopsis sp. GM8]
MRNSEALAGKVVSALSQYLSHQAKTGGSAFRQDLEMVRGEVEIILSDPFHAEAFARFLDHPGDATEMATLRLYLARALEKNPAGYDRLEASLGGSMHTGRNKRRRGFLIAATVVGLVVAVGLGYLLARTTGTDSASPSSAPPVVPPANTVQTTVQPITSGSEESTTPSFPSSSATASAAPGDGSAISKGTPVFLTELPRPSSSGWEYEHGDHDVQLTPYPNSLWHGLNTCGSNASKEQQFRLKNFDHLEVKAAGTDSTSDPGLGVKFEVFANDNEVNPLSSVVAGPGETKTVSVDLPANTFSLTLKASLTTVDKSKCRTVNAVWGAPYVVAAGS